MSKRKKIIFGIIAFFVLLIVIANQIGKHVDSKFEGVADPFPPEIEAQTEE